MGLKVYLDEDLERRFRRLAMEAYGYGRGALSRAAEEAIRMWIAGWEEAVGVEVPEDPVEAIRGLLKGVGKSGVELQHEARRIRIERFRGG